MPIKSCTKEVHFVSVIMKYCIVIVYYVVKESLIAIKLIYICTIHNSIMKTYCSVLWLHIKQHFVVNCNKEHNKLEKDTVQILVRNNYEQVEFLKILLHYLWTMYAYWLFVCSRIIYNAKTCKAVIIGTWCNACSSVRSTENISVETPTYVNQSWSRSYNLYSTKVSNKWFS